MQKYYTYYQSPFCRIILVASDKGLTNLHLDTGEVKRNFNIEQDWILNKEYFPDVESQLDEYFEGIRTSFDVKLDIEGTEFQLSVWDALQKIPYGETKTYKDIAVEIGKPDASRAVGMSNSNNPVPLIIPCHRVVGSSGKLVGFANGVAIKEKLINFEKGISGDSQLDLFSK